MTKQMPIESRLLFARKGQTQRPKTLDTLAPALGAEATTAYLGPALVVVGGSHADRPGSSWKFAAGP